jgi:predicted nucleic acid-binding Zn ribbon protein
MERKIKDKKCKECGNTYTPFNSLQQVCSHKCHSILTEKKEWKKKKAELKVKLRTRTEWLNTLQKLFNQWIRLRDKNKGCISCDKPLTAKFDAGHFLAVGSYPNLRFNEDNVHGQCVHCNQHKHGASAEYFIQLPNRIGLCKFNELLNSRNESLKLTLDEIQELIKIYKLKIKEHGKSTNN